MSNRLSNLTIISLAESILYSSHTTFVFVVQSLEVVCISEIKNVGVLWESQSEAHRLYIVWRLSIFQRALQNMQWTGLWTGVWTGLWAGFWTDQHPILMIIDMT